MADTTWFRKCGWGVITHYLADMYGADGEDFGGEAWSRRVDSFDVPRLARQLGEVGAGYYYMTIGQCSGHYCSPNATYDDIVSIRPSKCSQRDLVADIADALAPRGIAMMMYLAAEGPALDVPAREALGWVGNHWDDPDLAGRNVVNTWPDKGQRVFHSNWQKVIREWSLRWGPKVRGWWIDGCRYKSLWYEHPEPPNLASFAAALRAGNDKAIVAFNGDIFVPVRIWTELDDYTCGEIAWALPSDPNVGRSEKVGGKQYHILSHLGTKWGWGTPRFPDELAVGYTKYVTQLGGVITWDVPIGNDGRISDEFVRQLAAIGRAMSRDRPG